MDGLKRNPAAGIPVVARRLKQKDEEWRRAQRDWNKKWKEIQERNLLPSLDHQARICVCVCGVCGWVRVCVCGWVGRWCVCLGVVICHKFRSGFRRIALGQAPGARTHHTHTHTHTSKQASGHSITHPNLCQQALIFKKTDHSKFSSRSIVSEFELLLQEEDARREQGRWRRLCTWVQ